MRELVEEELAQRGRGREARVEAGGAFLAHDAVRILALGQEQEEGLPALAHARQDRLHRLPGRAAAGAVAVEAEIDVGGIAEQQLGMIGSGRGAERGHRLRHAVLEQRDHVHVTLDHDQPRDLRVRLPHLPQAVEFAALVEQRGLGRVEVFRPVVLFQHAAAEGDHAAAAVVDREHHPGAELVVHAAAVATREHAGLFQQGQPALVGTQRRLQAVVAFGRVTDGESGAVLRVHAAAVEIAPRLLVALELRLEEARGGVERGVLVAGVGILVAVPGFLRHFHTGALGQFLDRVEELEAVVVHQEADGGAVRAAAEAVVELLVGRDGEAGRALVVEGAARRVLAALALERHSRADHLDDVGACQQVVDEGVGDAGHGD